MVLGVVIGAEVDKCVVQLGNRIALGDGEFVLVVIVAETAAEDALHVSLTVLNVCIGLQHVGNRIGR